MSNTRTHAVVARNISWDPDYWDFWTYSQLDEISPAWIQDIQQHYSVVEVVQLDQNSPAAKFVNRALTNYEASTAIG